MLLPDPRFVLEPQFYGCAGGKTRSDGLDRLWKVFLNWSAASGSFLDANVWRSMSRAPVRSVGIRCVSLLPLASGQRGTHSA